MFLGCVSMFAAKVHANDTGFFKKFTAAREKLEAFLIENKGTIGLLLQNMTKATRVPNMRDLLQFLVDEFSQGKKVSIEDALKKAGARGRVLEITVAGGPAPFSDETKSAIFVKQSITTAIKCPICKGLLDPSKSVQYDHKVPLRDGGPGSIENGQMVHPYCNQSIKQ